jgi:hypothetical protein
MKVKPLKLRLGEPMRDGDRAIVESDGKVYKDKTGKSEFILGKNLIVQKQTRNLKNKIKNHASIIGIDFAREGTKDSTATMKIMQDQIEENIELSGGIKMKDFSLFGPTSSYLQKKLEQDKKEKREARHRKINRFIFGIIFTASVLVFFDPSNGFLVRLIAGSLGMHILSIL